jgi:TonB family protein
MFTNLIESDSHAKEFKRRSSFFLATVAVYSLILSAAGIAGVLFYDARVEAQNTEMLVDFIIPPVRAVREHEPPKPDRPAPRPASKNVPIDQNVRVPERINPTTTTDNPIKIPDEVGTKPSDSLPVSGPVVESNRNVNPPGGSGNQSGNCTNCPDTSGTADVEPKPAPAPPPVAPQGPQKVTSHMLISKVIDLPKPVYSQMAKTMRAQGPVNVQILVDEGGRVISAHAVSGNAILIKSAEEAARRARFTPTMLNNQPVKVQGVITYNFVLQ